MSQVIKDRLGNPVSVNMHGSSITIDGQAIPFKELLPVMLHYVKGGLLGHCDRPDAIPAHLHPLCLDKENKDAIEAFIREAGKLRARRLKSRIGAWPFGRQPTDNLAYAVPQRRKRKK